MMTDLHPELKTWIDTATENLAPEGKARVVEDVVRHYEAVLDGQLDLGSSPKEAHRVAMGSLGNVKRAKRDFQRIHLTLEDLALINGPDDLDYDSETYAATWRDRSLLLIVMVVIPLPAFIVLGFLQPNLLLMILKGIFGIVIPLVTGFCPGWPC